jgi:hypothetical protein
MSIYAVNLAGRRALKDPAFRAKLTSDPRSALGELDLTDDERAALLAGDVAALYEMGAHEYLLMGLARCGVLGLDPPTFGERIRQATPHLTY